MKAPVLHLLQKPWPLYQFSAAPFENYGPTKPFCLPM
jgi:hypothetical protein